MVTLFTETSRKPKNFIKNELHFYFLFLIEINLKNLKFEISKNYFFLFYVLTTVNVKTYQNYLI